MMTLQYICFVNFIVRLECARLVLLLVNDEFSFVLDFYETL